MRPDEPQAAAEVGLESARPMLRRLLTAPAPVALVLAVAVIVPAVSHLAARPAASVTHRVDVGVSTYPATVTAVWHDRQGRAHTLDVWAGQTVTIPASDVVLAAVAPGDGSIQCTLTVDRVSDTQAAQHGAVALCVWSQAA